MEWRDEVEKVTDAFKQSFWHLNKEQLDWKPNPVSWSISENMLHLIEVNESYFPVLDALKEGKYKAPLIAKSGFVASLLGRTVLKAVLPDRQKKMKTFPLWEPRGKMVGEDIFEKFERHQKTLGQKIEGAKELINRGVVISSPANRHIVYKLEVAFDIIVTHEQRHLVQAKEVLFLLKD